MYNKTGIQEITGMNWLKFESTVDSFRIKSQPNGLYTFDQMKYIDQCYKLKKDSGLKYSFIKKMPIRLIKEMIRMNEDPDKELKRRLKKEYDKHRYLKKTE